MAVGTQVGAYRLLQEIGKGGMGTVWLAEHVMLGRRAAIKLLHPMYTARQDIVTRFFNEARAATAIADPGIVQIFDFGHHVDGTAFIAMEMLEGEPLDRRLVRLGRLAPGDALRIMRQVASSLGVAHARGIVHRDLKPENVIVVHDPEVVGGERAKILDFGIAKLTGDPSTQTTTSAVMGTPLYMSPEQCRGAGQVDQRSDVYSLGCMLFSLVTGGPPFQAEGSGDVLAMHLRELPPAPSSRLPGLPPAFDRLVLRCLAKEPHQRFASGTELAVAIGEVSAPASGPAWPRTASTSSGVARPGTTSTTLSAANGATLTGTRRRSRNIAAATAGALVLGGVVIAAVLNRGGRAVGDSAATATIAGDHAAAPVEAHAAAPSEPAPAAAPVPNPPPAPAVAPSPPAPAAAPAPPDPSVELGKGMARMISRFVAWSRDHAGAPCPRADEIGPPVLDPWGKSLAITCTDQPAKQIIGVVSSGRDGIAGNDDDVGSWQLVREIGRDVIDQLRGPRWTAAPARPAKPAAPPRPRPARPKVDDDDIPTTR